MTAAAHNPVKRVAGLWRHASVPLALLLLAVAACREQPDPPAPTPEVREPLFTEVAAASGIDFVHHNGASGGFTLPELMHAGVAFVDVDNDSFLDVYLVQSGPLSSQAESEAASNRLYRNQRDGTFVDATDGSGLDDRGYGTGVAVADFDRDGWVDVYVTNWGPNRLYHNRGDGTFRDVTAAAGVGDPGYASSAAFFDYDGDGDLDLYVVNYVDWNPQIERPCFGLSGIRGYCAPDVYERPQRDTLYRNNGDRTFTDVSRQAGVHSQSANGLGVVTADFDRDGRADVYVSNDRMANHLWINRGNGTFTDEALLRGAAVNMMGEAEAGMGVVVSDLDANGWWDLFVAHLGGETNTFYANEEGLFTDRTDRLALGAVSRAYTGFGAGLFDFDCDGRKDLFLANGRVRLGDSLTVDSYAEPNQLLRGRTDGSFAEVTRLAGPAFELEEVSRGAAFGDYDNDGDVDILVGNNAGPARLLRNEATGCRNTLTVQPVGLAADRDVIGTEVIAEIGGRRQHELVSPAWSYGSANDPRVHVALAEGESVDRLTVIFPSGVRRTLRNVAGGSALQVHEEGDKPPAEE